jgi:hypothetical protein
VVLHGRPGLRDWLDFDDADEGNPNLGLDRNRHSVFMVDRPMTKTRDTLVRDLALAFAAGRYEGGETLFEMYANIALKFMESRDHAQCPQERLAEAERVIRSVVTSYPVAAGTSKYGFEEGHDGYGSIRECRLYLERFASPDTSTDGHTRFCAIHTVGHCTCSLSPPERQP